MTKTHATAFYICVFLLAVSALWGKEKKLQKNGPSEETYLGSISCTVTTYKVVPPKPTGDFALEAPPNQVAPPKAANGVVNPNPNDAAAPQGPGNDGTAPVPAPNTSPSKPILNLRDCLAHGGQVVILP